MNPIQDLLKMRGDILAYHTIIKGEFDKEIARLEALTKEVEQKLGMVKVIEDAHTAAAAIRSTAEILMSDAKAKHKHVLAASEAVKVREAAADDKANQARQMELMAQTARDILIKDQAEHAALVAKTLAEQAQTQASLNASAQALVTQREVLEAKAASLTAAIKGM